MAVSGVASVEVMASDFGGVVVIRGGEAIVIGVMGIAIATVDVTTGVVGVVVMIGNRGLAVTGAACVGAGVVTGSAVVTASRGGDEGVASVE